VRAKGKTADNVGDKPSGEEDDRPKVGRVVPIRGSVRAQIKMISYLKELKQEEAKPSVPARKTKFRRSKDEALDSVNYRKSGEGDPDRTVWVPGSNMAYGTWLLLVDGYNIVGASERLATLKNCESLDAARTVLIEEVVQLASMRGWRIEIVFDSYMTGRAGSRDPAAGSKLVSTVFTGSRDSADSYMEKTSLSLSSATGAAATSYAVATNDRAIINAVTSHGGMTMSSDRFLAELSTARNEAGFIASSVASRQNRAANLRCSADDKNDDAECNVDDEKDDVGQLKRARAAAKATKSSQQLQKALKHVTTSAPIRFTNFIELPFDLAKKVNAGIRAQADRDAKLMAAELKLKAAKTETAAVNKARQLFRGKAIVDNYSTKVALKQKLPSQKGEGNIHEIDSLAALAAATGLPAPQWEVERPGGAIGSLFTAIVSVGEIMAIGEGGTKMEAKVAAARAALREASDKDLPIMLG
jgi:predicted RNA-binding protein with PIN domain